MDCFIIESRAESMSELNSFPVSAMLFATSSNALDNSFAESSHIFLIDLSSSMLRSFLRLLFTFEFPHPNNTMRV